MKTFLKATLWLTVNLLTATAMSQPSPKNPPRMNPSESDKIVLYQIYTRLFGNLNSTNKFYGTRDENGVGKFNDITDKALTSLKKFGISHVWFTGVIEHATMTDYSANGILKDNPYDLSSVRFVPKIFVKSPTWDMWQEMPLDFLRQYGVDWSSGSFQVCEPEV